MESKQPENLRRRGNEKGTTSAVVARNVRRLRADRDLRAVSNRLGDVGWPISVAALSRLENGERRIDVDDLMAIAVALDVSPIQLLLPRKTDDERPVATGIPVAVNATEAKAWARELAGLSHQDRIDYWNDQERLWRGEVHRAEERPASDSPELRKMAAQHLQRAKERLTEARDRLSELLAEGGSLD